MSESEEHEMDEMSMDIDEETGLTAEERQKYFERKRQHDNLDIRIAGVGTCTQSDSADKLVVRNLLINGALIGLWYIFSLSISIVCVRHSLLPGHPDINTVQQMDVLIRSPRFSLPIIHDLPPHACPVLSGLADPRPHTLPPTISNTIPFRAYETVDHASILLHTPRTMRRDNLTRYRAWQHFITIYHAYLLYDVQKLCPWLCTIVCFPIPARVAKP